MRSRARKSQDQYAKELGINRATLLNMEKGIFAVSTVTLKVLLGLDVDDATFKQAIRTITS